MPKYLTTAEAAQRLSLTRQRIVQLINAGFIKAERLGKAFMIPEDTLPKHPTWPTKPGPHKGGKVIKKLHFYGVEMRITGVDVKTVLHRFDFLKDLIKWLEDDPKIGGTYSRYQEYTSDGLVRRALRRMAKDPTLTWPITSE